jgi:fucose permease
VLIRYFMNSFAITRFQEELIHSAFYTCFGLGFPKRRSNSPS